MVVSAFEGHKPEGRRRSLAHGMRKGRRIRLSGVEQGRRGGLGAERRLMRTPISQ